MVASVWVIPSHKTDQLGEVSYNSTVDAKLVYEKICEKRKRVSVVDHNKEAEIMENDVGS